MSDAVIDHGDLIDRLTLYEHREGYDGKDWEKIASEAAEAIRALHADKAMLTGQLQASRAMLAASTPVGGWEDISTAPKDGTMIITWCVHANAEHCEDAVADGYAGPVLAKWIDHNGGGFAWHGLAGQHTHWMPLPPPPSVSIGSRPHEAVTGEGRDAEVLALRTALKALLKACYSAEAGDGLPYEIDGSLLDAGEAALGLQFPVIWTPEQVALLEARQADPMAHPYTCGGNRSDALHKAQAEEDGDDDTGVLIPTARGWVCPACDYRQFWSHETGKPATPQPADGCSSNDGADGWIEHDGGPNPVPGQRVDVRWRDGEVSTDEPSRDWCWKPTDGDDTIIAYRILPQTEKGS